MCIDSATQNYCPNFPYTHTPITKAYAIVADPLTSGTCLWALGDAAILISFSASNPSQPCGSSSPTITVTPAKSYCASSKNSLLQWWLSAQLLNANKSVDYAAFSLTIFDASGKSLPRFTGIDFSNIISLANLSTAGNQSQMPPLLSVNELSFHFFLLSAYLSSPAPNYSPVMSQNTLISKRLMTEEPFHEKLEGKYN